METQALVLSQGFVLDVKTPDLIQAHAKSQYTQDFGRSQEAIFAQQSWVDKQCPSVSKLS